MTKRRTWTVAACVATIAILGALAGVTIADAGTETGGTAAPEGTAEDTQPSATTTTSSTATAPVVSRPTRAPTAGKLTLGQAVGQMLISHVTGLTASPALLKRIRAGQVGSVILYSENISTTAQLTALTASLQGAARNGHNPPLFIGADQEGGPVKRLEDAPPWLSAAQMGATRHVKSVAQAEGRAAGRALLRAGVNLDFAPVADIPTSANNFLGERAFGGNTRIVEEGVTGFATGLEEAHVAGSVKHFPGLGGAGPRDTDTEIVTIDLSKPQLRSAWAPYRAVAKLGATIAPLVMVSNAIYPALDHSELPADLSSTIVRNQLASTGLGNRVTVTDDLEVPAIEHYPDAAVKAIHAGIDLLMFAQEEAASERAFSEIMAAVKAGAITDTEVITAADRVVALKSALSLS
jgi:beta-N-acetylhexosaminidase